MGETIKAQYFPIMLYQREERKIIKILMAPNFLSCGPLLLEVI